MLRRNFRSTLWSSCSLDELLLERSFGTSSSSVSLDALSEFRSRCILLFEIPATGPASGGFTAFMRCERRPGPRCPRRLVLASSEPDCEDSAISSCAVLFFTERNNGGDCVLENGCCFLRKPTACNMVFSPCDLSEKSWHERLRVRLASTTEVTS